jgi:uncharacterized protein (DUF1800 family)
VNKVSERERISHVVRRLGLGAHPNVVAQAQTPRDAVALALDLSAPPARPPVIVVPTSLDEARQQAGIVPFVQWWIEQMRTSPRLIEERLVWFWQDHFATSLTKVRVPYLMWRQHLTIREHATGSFATLLHAMAKDPAMLVWLDGVTNTDRNRNENFGRECLELFTLGRAGGYNQDDVVAASRSFTGWQVNVPGRASTRADVNTFDAFFVPRRHDGDVKTLLGRQGNFDLDAALDVILEHPSTARFVATKLYRELVGLDPDPPTIDRLAAAFGRDYDITRLVHTIAGDPSFTADAAVRTKVRTPVEKLVALLQAVRTTPASREVTSVSADVVQALRRVAFMPFAPPNVGGFPKGQRLLGPHQLVHTLDLLRVLRQSPTADLTANVGDLFARFGVFDVDASSSAAVTRHDDPAMRLALVLTSPEMALT